MIPHRSHLGDVPATRDTAEVPATSPVFRTPSVRDRLRAMDRGTLLIAREACLVPGDAEAGLHPHAEETVRELVRSGIAPSRVTLMDVVAGKGWGPRCGLILDILHLLTAYPIGVVALRSRDNFGGHATAAGVLCHTLVMAGGILWVDGQFIDPGPLLDDEAALRALAAGPRTARRPKSGRRR